MSSRARAVWMLGAMALAAIGLGVGAPDAGWLACALLAPAAWPGLREWLSLRPRLAGVALVAAGMAVAGGQPAIAAAALVMGVSAGGRAPRSLAAAAVGLAGATWALRGQPAAAAVLAMACGAATLLQLSDAAAEGALSGAARRGIVASGRDALRAAAGIDGVVLALPRAVLRGRAKAVPSQWPCSPAGGRPPPRGWPEPRPSARKNGLWPSAGAGRRGPTPPGAAPDAPDDPNGWQAAARTGLRQPPRPAVAWPAPAPEAPAAAGLRALGCEVWQRGRVVPLRPQVDGAAFAVADMLARGRRVAVVAPPGGPAPAGDLLVQTGGHLRAAAAPAVALPEADLGALVDFLRLARRLRRACAGIGLAAVLVGGPGVAWAAAGRLPAGAAAWLALGAAIALAAGAPPPIFTSSQRRYG